jgi:hypothetical protein
VRDTAIKQAAVANPTDEQVLWRKTIEGLDGVEGTVVASTADNRRVSVDFGGKVIEIDYTALDYQARFRIPGYGEVTIHNAVFVQFLERLYDRNGDPISPYSMKVDTSARAVFRSGMGTTEEWIVRTY